MACRVGCAVVARPVTRRHSATVRTLPVRAPARASATVELVRSWAVKTGPTWCSPLLWRPDGLGTTQYAIVFYENLRSEPEMRHITHEVDLCVVGGGLADGDGTLQRAMAQESP